MNSIIQFFYLALFFFTPLIFTSATSELFEVPKMYFVYLITIVILSFHLINWLQGKVVLLSKNKLLFPLSLFLLSQIISTIFSVDSQTSIFGYYSRLNGGLLSLVSFSLLFLVLSQYINPKFQNKIIGISLISGFLVSSYGILEHFGIDKQMWVQDVQNRVFSTLGQPNWLAAYLCILLPIALDKYLSSKKIYFLFLIANFYTCLLFTKSKSGILAAIISLAIYFVYKLFKKSSFLHLISCFLVFIFLSITIANPIKDIIFPQKILPPTTQTSTLNITPSEDIRKIVWQGSIDLWKRFPLFGTGPETFAYTYYWTRPASHNLTSEWDFLYNKAHNEYLNFLATTGTFGFLAYIFLIISILILCLGSPAILTSFISILITNFAGFSVVITSLFFFLLPALLLPEISLKPLKKQNKLFYSPIIIFSLYLLIKLLSFFIADLAFSQSQKYLDHQQFTTAQDFINLSLYLRPQEADYQSQAAVVAVKLGQNDLAVSRANMAIKLSPASTNLWKERAQIFSQLALVDPKYFTYAIDALEKCSRLAPTDAKVFFLLGKFYEAASEKDLAIKNYQQALNLKPNYDHASFALGQIYYNDKKYSDAQKYFETTLIYAPANSDAQNYLSLIATISAKKK